MKVFRILSFLLLFFSSISLAVEKSINQTDDISPVLSGDSLPFKIKVDVADFSMPVGLHSYASAIYKDKWVFIAGRTNGLHGFQEGDTGQDNFPLSTQNTAVIVVDFLNKQYWQKSLLDKSSGLTREQVDSITGTNPQCAQHRDTLYITGGYGYDTIHNKLCTFPTLTAVNLPGIINWVTNPHHGEKAANHIRQIHNPLFQVTGGYMDILDDDLNTLLVFGQNFSGNYAGDANGEYTNQARRFRIIDNGTHLKIRPQKASTPDPNYRRRDVNIVPIMCRTEKNCEPAFIALSGVFTDDMGAWTVPVKITTDGMCSMTDPKHSKAFKQAMNAYACANVGLFSEKTDDMYLILFGGISYGRFTDGKFNTNKLLPFVNDITAIKLKRDETITQHIMGRFPLIRSKDVRKGNELLFGTGSGFFVLEHLPAYYNGVLKLDELGNKPVVLGYIVGGIQSTMDNTEVYADTCSSSYIFQVTLIPK